MEARLYNKIFTKILDSSIWMESMPTRIVWLTFLAAMDQDGYVEFASVANVAHRAIVPLADAQIAIAALEAPDANSSDPENGGRRIERIDGGWLVLNAGKYREIVSRAASREKVRDRVRAHRDRKRLVTLGNACNANGNAEVTQSDADTDADTETSGECRGDYAPADAPSGAAQETLDLGTAVVAYRVANTETIRKAAKSRKIMDVIAGFGADPKDPRWSAVTKGLTKAHVVSIFGNSLAHDEVIRCPSTFLRRLEEWGSLEADAAHAIMVEQCALYAVAVPKLTKPKASSPEAECVERNMRRLSGSKAEKRAALAEAVAKLGIAMVDAKLSAGAPEPLA